jgi:hypothetical protein
MCSRGVVQVPLKIIAARPLRHRLRAEIVDYGKPLTTPLYGLTFFHTGRLPTPFYRLAFFHTGRLPTLFYRLAFFHPGRLALGWRHRWRHATSHRVYDDAHGRAGPTPVIHSTHGQDVFTGRIGAPGEHRRI